MDVVRFNAKMLREEAEAGKARRPWPSVVFIDQNKQRHRIDRISYNPNRNEVELKEG